MLQTALCAAANRLKKPARPQILPRRGGDTIRNSFQPTRFAARIFILRCIKIVIHDADTTDISTKRGQDRYRGKRFASILIRTKE